MENTRRNVNLIKPIYRPNTGLPFSKPRYILDDELKLINMPPTPPEQIPEILENITTWKLATYEHFLRPENYQDQIWLKSRLIALILEIFSPVEADPFFYDLNEEPARLTLKIIETFKGETEANGSDFLIIHIPIVLDLINLRLNRELAYADLLAAIEAEHSLVYPHAALLEQASEETMFALFRPGGHYSAVGNKIIAEVIAEQIIATEVARP